MVPKASIWALQTARLAFFASLIDALKAQMFGLLPSHREAITCTPVAFTCCVRDDFLPSYLYFHLVLKHENVFFV